MSADNWTQCPKCLLLARKKERDEKEQARLAYGKVSAAEYHRLVERAKRTEELNSKGGSDTLREDYEIGVDWDGKFTARYFCHCDQCGFEYRFRKEEKLDLG